MIKDLPNKDEFYASELPRLFRNYKGFSRSSIYRKISEGQIEAEYISERVTIIKRDALVAYLQRITVIRSN